MLAFDATFYQSQRPDVFNAFIATGGSTGLNFAQFAENHYNTFGRFEGSNPNATFNTLEYLNANPDVAAAGVNPFQHFLAFGAEEGRAPNASFPTFSSFNEATYASANPDLAAAGLTTKGQLYEHFAIFGQFEGRPGTPDTGAGNVVGQSFALTTGADSVTGTINADTITGAIDDNTAANNTFTVLDTIDGGAGTDRFNITADVSGGGIAFPAATVSNVENFFFRNVSGQTLTVDANTPVGEEQLWSDRSTSQVDFTNVGAGVAIGVAGNGTTTNGAVNATFANSVTSGTLAVTGGTTAGAVAFTAAGMTSASIATSGSVANTLGAIDFAAASTVNVGGTANLTAASIATTATDATLNVTGAGAFSLGTLDAGIDTVAAGSHAGGLTLTLDAEVDTTVTAGTGNDSITTGAALTTGSVNAGAGTDTLTVGASAHLNSTTLGGKYTNFETLGVVNGVSVDLDNISGITAVEMTDGAGATALTDLNATQAGAVTIKALAGAATIGVKNATQVGTNDTLNITVSDGDTTTAEAVAGTGDLTIAGVETINITATDDITLASTANITGMNALTVSGPGDVSITTDAMAVESNTNVNFSGLTKASTFNFAAATGNAIAFTGGAGVDTVTDNVIGGNIIVTGAGNDAITLTDKTGGTAVTEVTGGAGADTVTVNMLGNEVRDGMKFNFGAGDSVSDSSTTGISATLTDTINNLDGDALSGTAGTSAEFDTNVQATAVTAGAAAVVLGTTTVTNAGDFFVHIVNATTSYIYQDTDGDRTIEAGEFAVQLTGIQNSTLAAGEFTVTDGDLILATA